MQLPPAARLHFRDSDYGETRSDPFSPEGREPRGKAPCSVGSERLPGKVRAWTQPWEGREIALDSAFLNTLDKMQTVGSWQQDPVGVGPWSSGPGRGGAHCWFQPVDTLTLTPHGANETLTENPASPGQTQQWKSSQWAQLLEKRVESQAEEFFGLKWNDSRGKCRYEEGNKELQKWQIAGWVYATSLMEEITFKTHVPA